MTDRYEEIRKALAHEIWAAAQLAPGEGGVDGVARIAALLRREAHPAITHCDNCGCDWLDNGLNPVGCPYCKQSEQTAEVDALLEEAASVTGEFARKWWSIHCATNKHMETTRKAHDDFCALQAAIRAMKEQQ